MRGRETDASSAKHADVARVGEAPDVVEDSTTDVGTPSSRAPSAPALQLIVLEAGGLTIHPLPAQGSVAIGRGTDCDVRISDALASRKHALLGVQPLTIEDLGSTNGTRLSGQRLEPELAVEIGLGQAISIGAALLIVRVAARGQVRRVGEPPASASAVLPATNAIVVRDPAMRNLYALAERLAKGQINILVVGETGVGKEVVVEAIHRASPRAAAPLMRINCATLSEGLLESELFGHERGAFTGAIVAKPGLIELASGGTVFLDEVAELSLALQAKLLRLIETREALRVGGLRPRPVDVRFLFATNHNLDQAVARGAFRSDLFFRIKGATIEVPPLRERSSEILPLAEVFAARAAAQMQIAPAPTLNAAARDLLLTHSWPGNLRELRNVIERAVLLCPGSEIGPVELALEPASPAVSATRVVNPVGPTQAPAVPRVSSSSDESERERIANALLACAGNQSRAAESLGMARRTLVRRIAQLGLPRPRSGS